ncbi:hypothetical protein AGMMS50293_27050 [Spirochaetia bacterium]|nr:hypothetical protein AGMMS50293_27050 [Spirochaetia bacterium]
MTSNANIIADEIILTVQYTEKLYLFSKSVDWYLSTPNIPIWYKFCAIPHATLKTPPVSIPLILVTSTDIRTVLAANVIMPAEFQKIDFFS